MPTVDNLDIQISAQVTKANASLTTLINRLDKLSASLMGVNSRGMATMGSGVNKLTNSIQNFSNATKTADFSRLARNLSSIGSIDGERVKAAASGIQSFAGALGALNKIPVSDSSLKIAELAKGISQLGYKSSTQAIDNIPKLATAMSQLMRELSKAPVVSRNLIDMTNALAKLARTGASSGRAAKSLGNSLDRYTLSTTRATKGTFSLASALGKLYATYWLLFRGFRKIGDAINIASDLYEVQNVVDVTFGNMASKVEEFAQTSIKQFGMSELTLKQVASRFQAMGSAMSIDKGSIANAQKYLNAQTNGYVELSDSMADVSLTLTKLTADMASFYNVEQSAVAEDLQSIFTGQTKPLRQYGVDLTEVNLKQWAMTQGLNSNIDAMTQAEKTMLRYQYVLAHTGAAQGDFARTSNSWANQIRILRQQFEQLGAVIGKTFIAALKPLINALNNAMSHIIAFAQTVSNALGKIFGWKFEVGGGGVTTDLESGADYAEDLAGGMSDAANSAKKLKSYLLGIDELNVIEPVEDASAGSSGGGGTGGAGGGGATGGEWIPGESILKEFESEIDTLYELGEYIRDTLIGMMESIDWESVYEKARGFGKGLAEFLNGLLAYDGEGRTLFGTVGKTFANTLNTIVYAALEFAKEFDFHQLGVNIADGINRFFQNFDFTALAETLNRWVDGFKETIRGFLEKLSWKDIISGISDFLGTLELDTVEFLIGAFVLKNTSKQLKEMVLSAISAKIAFATNPINIPNILLAFGKISVSTSPGMTGQIGIVLGDLLNHSFLDPREWGNWFGDLSNKIYETVNNAIEWIGENVILKAFEWLGNSIKESIEEFKSVFNWDDTLDILGKAKEHLSKAFNAPWIEGEGIFSEEVGKNLLLGIIEGFVGAFSLLAEPVVNFFNELWKNICDVFGIHSPAENMKPLGINILLGIVEGFRSSFESFTTAITEFFDVYVMPWFTAEKWYEILNGIIIGFQTKWAELVEWWNNSAIVTWWNENVAPWFTLEKWSTMLNNIKTSFNTKWTETVNQWKTAIKKWWDEHVMPWFTKERWLTLGENLKNGIYEGFKGLANKVVDVLNNVISSLESMINSAIGGINDLLSKISQSGLGEFIGLELSIGNVSFGRVPHFYQGGYVPTSYSMFVAGESGVPELLGTVGGRTAVAGGAEITGIREAVYETGQAEIEAIRQQNELLNNILSAILEKDLSIGDREIVESYERGRNRIGYAF